MLALSNPPYLDLYLDLVSNLDWTANCSAVFRSLQSTVRGYHRLLADTNVIFSRGCKERATSRASVSAVGTVRRPNFWVKLQCFYQQ